MQDFLHLHWILGLTHIAGKPPPNPNRFEPIIRPCKLDDEISMLSPRYSALFHAHLILLVFSSKIVWTALCPTLLTRASKGTYPSLLFHKSSQEARSRPCFLPQCVNMTKKSTLLFDVGTCGPIQFRHPLEDGACGRCQLVDHSRTRILLRAPNTPSAARRRSSAAAADRSCVPEPLPWTACAIEGWQIGLLYVAAGNHVHTYPHLC